MVKEDEKAYFMCQYSVFYWEYENEKKTGPKNLTFLTGIWTPVCAHKFNFEGDDINKARYS